LARLVEPQLQGDLDVQRHLPIARHTVRLVGATLAFLLLVVPSVASAQSRVNEGAARALDKKAMDDDYLNTDFDKATEKLTQAIAKCGTDKCRVPLRAQLKRDLAAVQSAAGHKDLAVASMTDAFKIDAGLELDPNFKTKDLEAVYAEAKKAASGGSNAPPPAGDFTVAPVTEQQVRTPIPIYVDYPGSETLKRVMAKYKGIGMPDWKSIELKPIGSGFGATTACADVQAGDFAYYVQGFNEANDPVASSGDRSNPFHVNVKTGAVGDPPHLPGASPPSQCADTSDCPPGLEGCSKGAAGPAAVDTSLKGEGVACEEDGECQSTNCKDMKCTAPPEDTSKPKRKKLWIGVAGSLDLSFLSSSSNVCELYLPSTVGGVTVPTSGATPPVGTGSNAPGTPTNTKGYYCTQNGTDFPSRANASEAANIVHNSVDSVGGGMVPGNIRLLASFDYAFTTNMMIGARLGYVARTYPGTEASHFPPIHAEARYSYVFGDDPIGKAGFHPIIFTGAGVSEFDASVSVAVFESSQTSAANGWSSPVANPNCKSLKCGDTVSAWQTNGPLFLEIGGGARWELTPGVAALLDLKLVGAIGGNGFAVIPTPEAGVQFGF
jgi:hypothetical protein